MTSQVLDPVRKNSWTRRGKGCRLAYLPEEENMPAMGVKKVEEGDYRVPYAQEVSLGSGT